MPPSYFFDEDTAAAVDAELEFLAALRAPQVRQLATLVDGLSPQTLKTLIDLATRSRELEGLPVVAHPRAGAGTRRRRG